MINLDSIKLSIPADCIKEIKTDKMIQIISGKNGNLISKKHVLYDAREKNKQIGLNNITFDEIHNKLYVDISAKILLADYGKLINLNTIENVFANINKNNVVMLHPNIAIDEAKTYNFDVTNDLHVDRKISDYIDMLSTYEINEKYRPDIYEKESVKFIRNVKSYNETLRIYDKEKDMMQAKNERMRQYVSPGAYQNILRVESMFNSHKRIKEIFDIQKQNNDVDFILLDVLKSDKKINYEMLNRVVAPVEQLSLFNPYPAGRIAWNIIRKKEGDKQIAKSCNYDIRIIKSYMRKYLSGNISRYVREMKQTIKEMRDNERNKKKDDYYLLDEIKEKLKVA